MTDFEQHLARHRLVAPSPELDQRIARTFASAARRASVARHLEPWWWFAALLSLGAASFVVFFGAPPPAPAEPAEIRFEANDALRRLLLEPPSAGRPPPHLQVRIQSS